MNENKTAVFDSGIGGISVLAELQRLLPQESFFFFADKQNAPYGGKSKEEILELMRAHCRFFLQNGCKAIVIACNTATSAAISELRREFTDIPIIGIEPAIKPALLQNSGRVLVLATELTVREKKLHSLAETLGEEQRLILRACPGLMELAEALPQSAADAEKYLRGVIEPLLPELSAVVLGCTHYSFFKPLLREAFPALPVYDGNEGVGRHLRHILSERGIAAPENAIGETEWHNSLEATDQVAAARYIGHCRELCELYRRG